MAFLLFTKKLISLIFGEKRKISNLCKSYVHFGKTLIVLPFFSKIQIYIMEYIFLVLFGKNRIKRDSVRFFIVNFFETFLASTELQNN